MASSKLEVLITRLQGYSTADQEKVLATFEAGLNSLVPKPPSFTLDMGCSDDLANQFGPDYELIEAGPEALTGNISWSLIGYLEEGDPEAITGTVLRERARKLGGFRGIKDGKKILELQDKIPLEYRRKHYIPLPATLYKHRSSERLYFPCFFVRGGEWSLDLSLVESNFYGSGRLLVPRKP